MCIFLIFFWGGKAASVYFSEFIWLGWEFLFTYLFYLDLFSLM